MNRMLSRAILLVASVGLFAPCAAAATTYCYAPNSTVAGSGTTHIESVSPQAGTAGVTEVYIQGWCFGNSPGAITLNNEHMNDIVFWTDAEVAFILPFNASTGDLSVSSQYGVDDTLKESQRTCGVPDPDWCGNDNVNASFVAEPPDDPPLTCSGPNCPSPPPSLVDGLPSAPQYADGTWDFNDGGGEHALSLAQGQQDSSGDWPITGTDENSVCTGQQADVSGSLDQHGDMQIYFACGNYCIEWLILGSGDVTSQGFYGGGGCPPVPTQNFLKALMDLSEGPYYSWAHPPLFKSATDQPSGEIPTFDTWVLGPPWDVSVNTTFGEWSRQFPEVLSGGNLLVEFAGRFVYEQNAGGASDLCYVEGAAASIPKWIYQVTSLSGGGWFVTSAGVWQPDDIGESSQWADWYQKNVALPCDWTISQEMYIDGRTTTYKYTLNQLTFKIDSTEIYSEVQPKGGSVVEGCEYYSNSKVTKPHCKP